MRCTRSRSLCIALIAIALTVAFAGRADAGLVAIEWDRSPDPAVIGYRVSVGTSPGNYTETFDVGSRTFFVYVAREARTYYLAVSSYAAGPQTGPLSQPVSATPHTPVSAPLPPGITDPRSFYGYLWGSAAPPSAGPSTVNTGSRLVTRAVAAPSAVTCWTSSTACLSIETFARRPAALTSLAAGPDGTLFVIEDEHRIVVITSDGLQFYTARSDAGTRFGQIVLDPHFADSGLMYVSEIDAGIDGSQEFRVVRYRVVENQAVERAVVISLPLPSGASNAVFAKGAAGHIYIAVPAAANGDRRTAYSGMLLRFNADGTVPDEQEGSPLFATGYVRPGAIVLDERTQRLWLAGVDDDNQASVSSLGESTSLLLAPAVSLAVSDAGGRQYLFAASDDGGFGRAQVETDGSFSMTSQLSIGLGPIRSVAGNAAGELFVAVDQPTRFGTTTLVVRLTPIQQR